MHYSGSGFILIVDDNPTNLSVLSQALKQFGLKIRMAMDGASAIKIVQQQPPELILLDVQMPGMDGFETCSRLKADPSINNIPIIFTTALADIDSKVKGLSLGAVDYITKPFEEQEVLARVKIHLQMRQMTKMLQRKNVQLQQGNEILEQRVQERTAELSQALQELQQSHLHLVQSEKMSALGQLVAGVAHELNNPIGCLVNNLVPAFEYVSELTQVIEFYQQSYPEAAQNLAQTLTNADVEFALQDLPKLLNSMKLSVERIQDISISLRNFSRSDATVKVQNNIHDGLESTLTILGHRLKGVGSRPRIEVIKEYGELPLVECYSGLLNQVFMNILANAIDALEETQSSNPEIRIKTSVTNQEIEIQIADNGIGMSLEIQQKIFDRFFTTKALGKGTGIGLLISRQIVEEKHKGQLRFMSQEGRGTEFTITLPIS